jgi:hypothetical protein
VEAMGNLDILDRLRRLWKIECFLLVRRSDWAFDPEIVRLELAPNSPLYAQLCADDGHGCTFPGKVVLHENLVCAGDACNGKEYDSTTLRTVRVQNGAFPIYYEYVRSPCVEQAFFNNAKRVKDYVYWSDPKNVRNNMCADPRRDVAVGKYSHPVLVFDHRAVPQQAYRRTNHSLFCFP